MFHRFDDDDGVIHHQSDGEDQTEKRKRIDGETQQRKKRECPDQRNRNRSKRDQGRPPALQENKDHQHHQPQRLPKSLADFVNPFGHRLRGVNGDVVVHVGREARLQFFHEFLDAFLGLDGVGVGKLKQGHNGRGFAIVTAHDVIIRGAQFNASHVPQAHHRPIRRGAENDVAKLLLRREPALGEHGVGEFLSGRRGTPANFAGWIDGILAVDGANDLRHGDIEFGQLVWFDPNPHGILTGAKNRHLRNARHPAQRVAQIDIGVVGQKLGAARAFGRIERENHERGGEGFLDRDSEVAHIGGQLRFRLGIAQLGQNVVNVRVGRQIEVDEQPHQAVVRVDRIHVVHVVHAAHLLFDGRGHGCSMVCASAPT